MGSGISQPSKVKRLHKSEEEIVRLMMPVYYNSTPITLDERKIALDSWNLILDDKSPVFLERKGTPSFPYTTCVTYFYDTFYTRLFDIHPMCRHMFKSGMRSQGKFLVKMISLALSELDDPEKFDKNLTKLAEIHYERGVKAVEYGIVGEVLFYVLRQAVGPTVYLQHVHTAWVKVYSRMLRTIVPVAIALELHKTPTGDGSVPAGGNRSTALRQSQVFSQTQTASFGFALAAAATADDDEPEGNLKSEKIRRGEILPSASGKH